MSFRLRAFGPGLIMAAAGIGAGDVVIASVTGIRFGVSLLWAVALTAALKFILTEALARWQLATGETLIRAWLTRLPRAVGLAFFAYLLLWSFLVGASLSSACGLAASVLFPVWDARVWGVVHAAVAVALVALNRFAGFQRIMKGLVACMGICVLLSAGLVLPAVLAGETGRPAELPAGAGGGAAVLALLGGIGGSLTIVCYGYWLRAAGWSGAGRVQGMRADVGLAYVFTGAFGMALCVIATGVPASPTDGHGMVLAIAGRLAGIAGPAGHWFFLTGFWCTVFAAMMGVWQGVAQIYVEVAEVWRVPVDARRVGLGALGFLAGPPLVLLWFKQPVVVVVAFSIAGAFVLPFMAGTLLYLNNRSDWMGGLRNRWRGNVALLVCVVAFGLACLHEVRAALRF